MSGVDPGEMQVIRINKATADHFVKRQHYSRRASIFWDGFGLLMGDALEGVCVFGQPSNPKLQTHAFRDRDFQFYELTRLVVQTDRKNAASFLIGNALKRLEAPCAVVAYADTGWSHCGIVYQATNWLYTGSAVPHGATYMVGGAEVHRMTAYGRGVRKPGEWAERNDLERIDPVAKHRYFFLCGDRRQKREMRAKLAYPVLSDYPKCDPVRYDAGPRIDWPMTLDLFEAVA